MGLHPSVLTSLWNGHLDKGKDKKRCLFLYIITYLIAPSQTLVEKVYKTKAFKNEK